MNVSTQFVKQYHEALTAGGFPKARSVCMAWYRKYAQKIDRIPNGTPLERITTRRLYCVVYGTLVELEGGLTPINRMRYEKLKTCNPFHEPAEYSESQMESAKTEVKAMAQKSKAKAVTKPKTAKRTPTAGLLYGYTPSQILRWIGHTGGTVADCFAAAEEFGYDLTGHTIRSCHVHGKSGRYLVPEMEPDVVDRIRKGIAKGHKKLKTTPEHRYSFDARSGTYNVLPPKTEKDLGKPEKKTRRRKANDEARIEPVLPPEKAIHVTDSGQAKARRKTKSVAVAKPKPKPKAKANPKRPKAKR